MDSPIAQPELAAEQEGGTEPQHSRAMTLKHGDSFAVFNAEGDVAGGSQGIYHKDTRHLSFLCLRLNSAAPELLSAALLDDNTELNCDLTNPALREEETGLRLPRGRLHLRRTRFLCGDTCHERLTIRNYDQRPHRIRLEFHFAADFADVFEVRGRHRAQRGQYHHASFSADSVTLSYTGLDGVRRRTALRFEPAPRRLEAQRAVHELELPPHGQQVLFLTIRCDAAATEWPREAFGTGLRRSRQSLRQLWAEAVAIESSHAVYDEALRRSGADLVMLVTQTPQGPYPYAGVPWYSTAFGRDALITAWQTLWLSPRLTHGVLRFLAANQATTLDPATDAEPGKILHETRQGEMALLGEVPFRRYYGSIDSTPLFIMLAGAYLDRTGDLPLLRELWPNIEAALGWIDQYGDADGDGFVEYLRKTPNGLLNQGWKDSQDSISHADGRLAEGPIALVEMQAYVYAAWRAAARIAARLGDTARAQRLEERAATLQRAFDAAFWDEALGTYVLALDGQKRPCRVRSSNAGHALFAGIALPHRAARVAQTLLEPASFCGWGIRTLAAGEVRFNPMSYHNGSVWPHDNAMIAEGFARYGLRDAAARLLTALFQAASYDPERRLPELFCGFPRRHGQGPTLYPVACSPQAWAASTPFALLRACLGLRFLPEQGVVTLDNPVLPDFLSWVTLRRLRLGDSLLDLRVFREGEETRMEVLRQSGALRAGLHEAAAE
ncbi:MAG TPA: amylo-alpha-1,6-glucosidase [Roseomonas sp.]|nr:amylo-alpha-1,6-glucosidase [Roseomonas sp.]